MLKQKLKITSFILAAALLATPVVVSAAGFVPCGGANEKACTVYDIFGMAFKVMSLAMAFGGVFAVFWIIYNGFGLVMSQGNQEAVTKYRGGITNAIIGFVLVILAFTIIDTLVGTIFPLNNKYNPLSNPKCFINSSLPGC